jgi:hypothetical protein
MKKYLCLAAGALTLSLTLSACGVELGYPGGPDGSTSNGQKGEGKRIFMTTETFSGDVTLEGADSQCNDDASTPSTGTYKALLASANRTPTTFLKASTQYIRPDGTVIGKTNTAKVFTFNLTNAISNSGELVWTGITREFAASGSHCNNWTDATNSSLGQAGLGNSSSGNSMANAISGIPCNVQHHLYCIEI